MLASGGIPMSDAPAGLKRMVFMAASDTANPTGTFSRVAISRRRLMAILENVPVWLAVSDAAMKTIRFNPAGASLIGMPPDANIADDYARGTWKIFEEGKQI